MNPQEKVLMPSGPVHATPWGYINWQAAKFEARKKRRNRRGTRKYQVWCRRYSSRFNGGRALSRTSLHGDD